MDRSEKALFYFDNHFNCAQSVLVVFAEEAGFSEDEALRIATAFGGGIGRQQFTCGAVTGAAMALGLRFGKGKEDHEDKKKLTYEKTVELFDEFIQKNGTANCRELLNGLDLNTEHDAIVEQNLFHTHCRKYIADAVKITGKLIDNTI